MRVLIVLALATVSPMLAACPSATVQGPRIETRTVEVPVAASCVPPNLGGPPAYPDEDAALRAARDGAERTVLLAQGRVLRRARQAQTEPVIAACRTPSPPG